MDKEMALIEEAKGLVANCERFVINDQKTLESASSLLSGIKDFQKQVKDYWKEAKESTHKAWKAIVAKETEMLDAPVKAEGIVKQKINAFLLEEQKKRDEIERKAAAEAAKIKARTGLDVKVELAQTTPVIEKPADIQTRDKWEFEVTDENKIPREYLMINEKAIQEVINALKDKAVIPGIKVVKKQIIVSKSSW